MRTLTLFLPFILLTQSNFMVPAQDKTGTKNPIYHDTWIDLNEKTCQTATLYGYKRVLQDELPTPDWKKQIWKDGIANIDEHLNGWAAGSKSIYATDIKKHVWAMNETQRFFIEGTRLG